jgi:rod shape-determining protein MreB
VAGDTLDEEIQDYFRREYNMSIGLKTAELVKKKVGCVYSPAATDEKILVKGKDLIEGIPASRLISQYELVHILERPFKQIEDAIHQSLQVCPPELAADIYQTGIYVTGGNALLKGIKERFTKNFKLPVNIDQHALTSVSKGISQILSNPQRYKAVLL